MIEIKSDSANELFIKIANELLINGKYRSPRGLKTLEIQDAFLILNNPIDNVVTLKSRNLNHDYLKAEMAWYLSGDLNIDEISKSSRFWNRIANNDGRVNSNYGFLALKERFNGITQFEWCVKRLQQDKDSRQAIINYNQPRHKYEGNKDFVCTISQAFNINNGFVNSTTLMRSNDLIYGLSYDLPWFAGLQKDIADKLNLPIGKYQHYAASLHVYEKHFKMLEEIAKDGTKED